MKKKKGKKKRIKLIWSQIFTFDNVQSRERIIIKQKSNRQKTKQKRTVIFPRPSTTIKWAIDIKKKERNVIFARPSTVSSVQYRVYIWRRTSAGGKGTLSNTAAAIMSKVVTLGSLFPLSGMEKRKKNGNGFSMTRPLALVPARSWQLKWRRSFFPFLFYFLTFFGGIVEVGSLFLSLFFLYSASYFLLFSFSSPLFFKTFLLVFQLFYSKYPACFIN